jgi:hypothetical protein
MGDHVKERLLSFRRSSQEQICWALQAIAIWRQMDNFPEPWTFANENGNVEFEWECKNRWVVVEVTGPEEGKLLACTDDYNDEEYFKGVGSYHQVPALLEWAYNAI